MARQKGAYGRKTLARAEVLRRIRPADLTRRTAAAALGTDLETASRMLAYIRKLGLLGKPAVASRGNKANCMTRKEETLPFDHLTPDELERARILGISPGRMAWLNSCPRGGQIAVNRGLVLSRKYA